MQKALRVRLGTTFFQGISTVLGLGGIALSHRHMHVPMPWIIAAFGASAVVLYGAPESPLAQPRNVFVGSLLASFIGVSVHLLMPGQPTWIAAIIAVSLSIMAMGLTDTMHPPAGAMAFIATSGPPSIDELRYHYLLDPIGSGLVIMVGVCILMHRIAPRQKRYPQRWW